MTFQARTAAEKAELDDKLLRLRGFLASVEWRIVAPAEQDRLLRQEAAMVEYSAILGERIAGNFK